ncbi:MAG: hypothetical protein GX871_03035, partial [Microbacteriaceae bacterium]|nr:hypothetical protein [Microbacteriaceae bacterium]
LEKHERLLGWLYVGGRPERTRPERPRTIEAERFVSRMPGGERSGSEDAPERPRAKKQKTSKKSKKQKASKSRKDG